MATTESFTTSASEPQKSLDWGKIDNVELFKRWQQRRDQRAREELVSRFLPLAANWRAVTAAPVPRGAQERALKVEEAREQISAGNGRPPMVRRRFRRQFTRALVYGSGPAPNRGSQALCA